MSSDNKQSSSSGSSSQQEQDDEASLRMLNAKRMLELRKRASLATSSNSQQSSKQIPKVPSDKEILQRALVDRGDEVLATAEANYPSEMRILIPRLANLIKQGKVTTLTGGELLQFLRAVGLRVSVSTTISVEEHGKFVSLADKLKQAKD